MDNFCHFVDRAGPPLGTLSTHWSVIRTAKDPSEIGKDARRALAQRYFRPVFHLLTEWGLPLPEAAEMANRMMERIIDGTVLEGADAKKGTFRSYLRRCLWNLLHEDERLAEVRREQSLEGVDRATPAADPMAILDREIAWEIFSQAKLATEARLRGDKRAWRILRAHDIERPADETRTQEQMAEILNISVEDFRSSLYRARDIFKEEVNRLLADGVETEEELRAEVVWFREQIGKGPPPNYLK